MEPMWQKESPLNSTYDPVSLSQADIAELRVITNPSLC